MKYTKFKRREEGLFNRAIELNVMKLPKCRLETKWDDLYALEGLYRADKIALKKILDFSKYYMDNIVDMTERGISLIYYGDNINFITSLLSVMMIERYKWDSEVHHFLPLYQEIHEVLYKCYMYAENINTIGDSEICEFERIRDCRFLIIDRIMKEKLYTTSSGRLKLLEMLSSRESNGLCTILGVNEDLDNIKKLISVKNYQVFHVPGIDRKHPSNIYEEYKKLMDGKVDEKVENKAIKKKAVNKQREGRKK